MNFLRVEIVLSALKLKLAKTIDVVGYQVVVINPNAHTS